MAKRIDPIRHWPIAVFVLLAVGAGVVLLPVIARYGRINLERPRLHDLLYIGTILGGLLMVEFMIGTELLDFLRDWRKRRDKAKNNPYDQR